MVFEAVRVEGPYLVRDYTVAAGTSISGGTLCVMRNPRTAQASQVFDISGAFAGISATDKDGTDGKTNLGLTKTGVHLLQGAGIIGIGEYVVLSGANVVSGAGFHAHPGATLVGVSYGVVALGTKAVIEVELVK